MSPQAAHALADAAAPAVLWLDTPDRPAPRPSLADLPATQPRTEPVDLVVVGGGFTGLWAALRAVEREPGRSVLLLERDRIAEHATGRNGGFCEASLTHGEENGRTRWPEEHDVLHRLGLENLDAIEATVARYGIECGFRRSGQLTVATRPHEVAALDPAAPGFLDAAAVRGLVYSPGYLAGRLDADGCAMLDPARLAWGLAQAAESLGVRIAEHTGVTGMRRSGDLVEVATSYGVLAARQVVLATNAFTALLPAVARRVVPVYDHVLATEPLTAAQLDSIGWSQRFGIADAGNLFHYYRLTDDDRILWGGYDAVYHFRRGIDPAHEQRPATHRLLAEHFYATFPQLADVGFSHRWGGVIDTCSRFCAFFGTTGRVGYAAGFTGLGVGASRFAADVVLDLLDGTPTERTRLRMVTERPWPFPPEPLAWTGIQLTRWAAARADATGRRNLWLRTLDRLGMGFDS
ncbi:FAD-dependent oxidoreductase [Nocardioides sp. zg-536]|uniref:FAD-dependent oxidoreductase n=1 Tax=Nocardioides faecalis TaxID=2803858 RepID=A0A939BW43_9ACTN|nr:FAD-dependent oxidoreductase [Nocardioides faecalis]MBM9460197.1 FAD-dependent oxidoreductase [Nocardioides faecalis]MBS4754681.1 FAD-dependent oxidoreductase [Nocardioides faecalis]QVI60011.1 FAD-dependent oxidoreductase [Nocardioides faecalis]